MPIAQNQSTERLIDKIYQALEQGIKEEAEDIFKRAKEQAIEELDRKKDEVVASIAIQIMNHVNLQSMGNNLVITVSADELKHE
ncbi:MAG: hypothetical protein KGJ07_01575 [Patescibacteria group bacterium]|nr:hypothetical protein [Patescibacteria group bacterium]